MHDLWANRTRGPQLEQQVVEILPFPINLFLNLSYGGSRQDNGDPLEVFGFGGSEHCDDPPG